MRKGLTLITALLFVISLSLGIVGLVSSKNQVPTPPPTPNPTNYEISFNILYNIPFGFRLHVTENNEFIEMNDTNAYIIAKDYSFYPNKLNYDDVPRYTFGKYNVYHIYNGIEEKVRSVLKDMYYYTYDDFTSEYYSDIEPVCIKDACDYLLLKDNNYHLLDMKTNMITDLKYNTIDELDSFNKYGYFKVFNNRKYGVIDKDNNILIDLKYNNISIVNEDRFYVETNNLYGIVNSKNEVIVDIKHNILKYTDNYITYKYIEEKNELFPDGSVVTEKKDVINVTDMDGKKIYTLNINGSFYSYDVYEKNGNLYVIVYSAYEKISGIYAINKKGLINTADKPYLFFSSGKEIYSFYEILQNKNQFKFVVYDLDFKEVFTKYLDYREFSSFEYYKDDIYIFKYYEEKFSSTPIVLYFDQYGDISNDKIHIKDFENGLRYTLIDEELKVFDDNGNVIYTRNDVDEYLGGYLFKIDNLIYKMSFKEV